MARKMRRCGHADIASVTKGFAGRRVRQMDLDHRNRDRLDRVVQRHRRMGIAAAVEERRLRPREMRLVQPVDQHALVVRLAAIDAQAERDRLRSEEHTSELQSLMSNSYADFCLKNTRKQKL